VQRSAISHSRLMRESTDRIESALRSEDDKDHHIAHRLLETTRSFYMWELEHSGLMRQVAEQGKLQTQALALRHAALRLIHGKALFEYLRTNQVRGEERVKILTYFHPTRLYEYAVVQEHGSYLRKAGSFLCTAIWARIWYRIRYFSIRCSTTRGCTENISTYIAPRCSRVTAASIQPRPIVVAAAKAPAQRMALCDLESGAGTPRLRRESQIRVPVGDTQRLPC